MAVRQSARGRGEFPGIDSQKVVKNDEAHHEGTEENSDRIEFGVGNHLCVYSLKRGI